MLIRVQNFLEEELALSAMFANNRALANLNVQGKPYLRLEIDYFKSSELGMRQFFLSPQWKIFATES